jgi:transposase-like protein
MKQRHYHHPTTISKEMAAVVAAYRQSGLSLEKFARERGIRPSQLHYWVYQKDQGAKSRSLTKDRSAGRGRAVFQEVKLGAASALLPGWAAEVSLSQGLNVRFSGTAGPDWIGAVIQSLQRPC